VTFDIDVDGILNASAPHTATGRAQSIRITGSTRLAKDEKERMITRRRGRQTPPRGRGSPRRRRVPVLSSGTHPGRFRRQAETRAAPTGRNRPERYQGGGHGPQPWPGSRTDRRGLRCAARSSEAGGLRRQTLRRYKRFSPNDLFAGIDFADSLGPFVAGCDGGLFDRLFRPAARWEPRHGRDTEMAVTVPLSAAPATGPARRAEAEVKRLPAAGKATSSSNESPPAPPAGAEGRLSTSRARLCRHRRDHPSRQCEGKIRAGVENGAALRIPGYGLLAPEPYGTPGDAYVIV
jgi:Hsp70 protein